MQLSFKSNFFDPDNKLLQVAALTKLALLLTTGGESDREIISCYK